MAKLTILRGVSGSGKSTWAREQNALVVSRDAIREAFFGSSDQDYYKVDKDVLSEKEGLVTVIQDQTIAAGLRANKHVIVDNTNTEWKFVKQIAKIGHRAGAEIEVKVFDVPVAVAVARNELRKSLGGRLVPEEVIRKQHSRLQGTKDKQLDAVVPPKPYTGTPGKPKAFMVDIDGTLAHMRDHRGPFDWKNVGLDEADEVIVDLVNLLGSSNFALDLGHLKVIVMSGRDEVCRPETQEWLSDYIDYDCLFMRPEGDMRPDNIVKAELFDNYVRYNFDVQFVLDDRNQVVDMWRSMGLTCLQVAEGDF